MKAIDQLTKTFNDDQTRLKAMAVEGIVHHQAGNTKKASELAVVLEKEVARAGAMPPDQTSLDVARLLMATGKQDRAVEFLKDQVRNNPDNAALLDEVKGIFDDAAMGEEGAALVETSRQEGVSYMNKGVLLARDGNYEAALSAMREARQVMPANVRMLFNSAYVIITCMQKIGVTADLVTEAQDALEAAHSLAPGQTRYNQLHAALKSLVSEAAAKPVQ